MSEYTVTLKWLLKQGYRLALDKYPIFDESYRSVLNQKIINHFWFREIGQETPDRFNFMLMRKLDEVMPYYNKMYESQLMEFDPLATEFFTEGRDTDRRRDYQSASKNKGKESQTVGEVFSSNEDTIGNTTFGETSKENNVGDYRKQGDKTSDTVNKKTEDFEGTKTSKTTEDFEENTTGKKTEDFLEKTSAESTTTTDMHTHEEGSSNHTATTTKSGSQDTVFSDIPQTGITTTTTTSPDGTVTRSTTGYATTTTGVDTAETTKLTENSSNTNQIDNTGTVKVDSSGQRTNDNTTDTTGNKTNDNITDYTENHTDDNITDFTENVKETWHESGDHTEDTDFKHDSNTDTTGNAKIDTERNTATNSQNSSHHSETSNTGEHVADRFSGKGRKGQSPADLIMKYRDSLINVDMMVINELETLFMQLY